MSEQLDQSARPAAEESPERWLTPGVKGIGTASLLADLGTIPTALLLVDRGRPRPPAGAP